MKEDLPVNKDHLDPKDQPDQPVPPVNLDHPDRLDPLAREDPQEMPVSCNDKKNVMITKK